MRAWAIAAAAALMAVAGLAQAEEKVAIPSITPATLPQFLSGGAPAATVSGELYLPKGQGPFPAMILKHGSGGLEGPNGANIRKWAATLNGWGVAAFVVDSFGPRGLKDTAKNQAVLSVWADVADSFAALKVLGADPRIDKSRIGIMGWSRGGSVVLDTTLEKPRQIMGVGDLKFALHVAFYAAAETQYRDSATDHAPILFLHGEADNYVPMGATREYADWLKSMGNPVTFISYPKTYHDFDVAGGYSGFAKVLQVGGHCDLVVDVTTGQVVRMGNKPVNAPGPDEIKAYYKTCVTFGATLQYNAAARADAVEKVHAFLKDNFHLAS